MTDDAAAAVFGPESLTRGALLPGAARDLMISSFALPPGVLDATADGWVSPEVPVLVREPARILPLAWWGAPGRGAGDEVVGTRSLAAHIVPESWVFEPAARGPVAGIDVRWSWADVVELHRSR